jgi:hypothetical protein
MGDYEKRLHKHLKNSEKIIMENLCGEIENLYSEKLFKMFKHCLLDKFEEKQSCSIYEARFLSKVFLFFKTLEIIDEPIYGVCVEKCKICTDSISLNLSFNKKDVQIFILPQWQVTPNLNRNYEYWYRVDFGVLLCEYFKYRKKDGSPRKVIRVPEEEDVVPILAIEIDGKHHLSPISNNETDIKEYTKQIIKDRKKENFLKEYNIETLRYSNIYLKENMNGAIKDFSYHIVRKSFGVSKHLSPITKEAS